MLDIGTGWGPLAQEVLTVLPKATLVAHDFSEPMLAKARTTLAPFGERVGFVRGDLTDEHWADGIGAPFDAVVSAHAIHNVRSHRMIAAVYATVRQLLAPGGWFLNLEIVDPAGPAAAGAYGRLRLGRGRAPLSPCTRGRPGGGQSRRPPPLAGRSRLRRDRLPVEGPAPGVAARRGAGLRSRGSAHPGQHDRVATAMARATVPAHLRSRRATSR